MRTKKILLAGLILVGLSGSGSVQGADAIAYDQRSFDQAQLDSNKITLLDFYSSRCSSCLKQAEALKTLLDEPRFKSISWFQVKYEGTPTPMTQKYEIDHSSLVVFRGSQQVGRGVGHMEKKKLRKLLLAAQRKK